MNPPAPVTNTSSLLSICTLSSIVSPHRSDGFDSPCEAEPQQAAVLGNSWCRMECAAPEIDDVGERVDFLTRERTPTIDDREPRRASERFRWHCPKFRPRRHQHDERSDSDALLSRCGRGETLAKCRMCAGQRLGIECDDIAPRV